MHRWKPEEDQLLVEFSDRVQNDIQNKPPFAECYGERKMLRFLRGANYDMEKSVALFRNFVKWREANNMDDIRQNIVNGSLDCAAKFPSGTKILGIMEQIVITHRCLDRSGNPISVERYDFSPQSLLSTVTLDELISFFLHGLELKMLVLEQLSQREENDQYKILIELMDLDEKASKRRCYGVIKHLTIIRDLTGIGSEHLTSQGLSVIKAILSTTQSNYPELLCKCYLINVSWAFSLVWNMITPFISERSLSKISLIGPDFIEKMSDFVSVENIPSNLLGGKGCALNEPVSFDPTLITISLNSQCHPRLLIESKHEEQQEEEDEEEEEEPQSDGYIDAISSPRLLPPRRIIVPAYDEHDDVVVDDDTLTDLTCTSPYNIVFILIPIMLVSLCFIEFLVSCHKIST